MRFDEMKKNFRSQISIVQPKVDPANVDYIQNLNVLLEKLVEKEAAPVPTVTQISKAKPPPLWAGESFERFKEQVIAWERSNKDPDYTKFNDFVEKLKQNREVPGLKDFVTTSVLDKLRDATSKTVDNVLECLEEKYAKTKVELFFEAIESMEKLKIEKSENGEVVWDRFERTMTKMSNIKVKDNFNYFMSMMFLKVSSESEHISEAEKREMNNVIDESNENNMFEKLKQCYKKIKVEGKRNHEDDDKKTFYMDSGRSKYDRWKRSQDFQKFQRSKSNPRYWRTRSGGTWRRSPSSKNRSVSRSQRSSSRYRETDFEKPRSNSIS